jgi:hypothetical protein
MGAVIVIHLSDCLFHRHVEIDLRTLDDDKTQTVRLRFTTDTPAVEVVFDTYTYDKGKIELSADFNFYRNPDRHGLLMRCLFENSIPFRVIP